MFGLGAGEILIILAFALIFIGPKKLPELARNLGKSIREFQKAKDELLTQVNHETNSSDEGHDHQEDHHEALTGVNIDDAEVDAEVKKMEEALSQNSEETTDNPEVVEKKPEGSV
jgi:TatA/E family protein of Tat protein translocase